MKFITEAYLRDLYRREPFRTFQLNQEERLTPGASQYLSDKRIDIVKEAPCNEETASASQPEGLAVLNHNLQRLCYQLKSLEARFLVTGSEILKEDFILAQRVFDLGKRLSNIRCFLEGKGELKGIDCTECAGINSNSFYDDREDCFEITEGHIKHQRSREILNLHLLRCTLRELFFWAAEINGAGHFLERDVIKGLSAIINSLSQMICSLVGGKICQKIN
ncbi:hypothetical protein [Alkaliphilus crotonatoxidans]